MVSLFFFALSHFQPVDTLKCSDLCERLYEKEKTRNKNIFCLLSTFDYTQWLCEFFFSLFTPQKTDFPKPWSWVSGRSDGADSDWAGQLPGVNLANCLNVNSKQKDKRRSSCSQRLVSGWIKVKLPAAFSVIAHLTPVSVTWRIKRRRVVTESHHHLFWASALINHLIDSQGSNTGLSETHGVFRRLVIWDMNLDFMFSLFIEWPISERVEKFLLQSSSTGTLLCISICVCVCVFLSIIV